MIWKQMTACLEQIKPVKKEYPGLAFVVTIFLAYTFWFLGLHMELTGVQDMKFDMYFLQFRL